MKLEQILCGLCTYALMSCTTTYSSKEYYPDISTTQSPKGTQVFKADSLNIAQNYHIPEWFRDAKFGIFIHWGVYSVPAYGSEWYPRMMYNRGSDVYKHHVQTYGEVTDFGYKDFIPMFKAEKFNANEWVSLFKESGAQYIVPVAEHHDGISMYKSVFNPWNTADMGPKRDFIAELKKEVTSQGLHFGVSSHRCENAWFFGLGMENPSDVQDMSNTLYGERMHRPGGEGWTPEFGNYVGSNKKSREGWLTHIYEIVDQYQPELLWFDWTVGKYPFQSTFYKFMAYYYNNAIDWGKEVVVNTKFGFGDESQVFDIERGKSDEIRKFPWQTDTSVGKKSWGYIEGEENKEPDHIINDFVDIVSKNGNLLLNIGPRADGSITEEQQHVLREIGKWLQVNGEAIYKSRPWRLAGEGSTKGASGGFTDNTRTAYTAQDIRFTTRDGFLYAIALDWSDQDVLVKSITSDMGVEEVSMLGSSEKIAWKQTAHGLQLSFPTKRPSDYAHVFKIKMRAL